MVVSAALKTETERCVNVSVMVRKDNGGKYIFEREVKVCQEVLLKHQRGMLGSSA